MFLPISFLAGFFGMNFGRFPFDTWWFMIVGVGSMIAVPSSCGRGSNIRVGCNLLDFTSGDIIFGTKGEPLTNMTLKRFLLLTTLIAIFGLVLAACGGGGDTGSGPAPLNVTIRGQDIKFDVTEIKAKVGQTVNVTYINEGTLEHNFIIEGVVPEVKLQPGQKNAFSFTPSAAGSLEYHCTIPGHLEAGMTGKIIIEP